MGIAALVLGIAGLLFSLFGPFGFIGAILASVILAIIYTSMVDRIHSTLAFMPILSPSPLLWWVTLGLLVAGTAIGALGSFISLRKFLRV